jgi:hypothetical protein
VEETRAEDRGTCWAMILSGRYANEVTELSVISECLILDC